jgi:hypothetical protein
MKGKPIMQRLPSRRSLILSLWLLCVGAFAFTTNVEASKSPTNLAAFARPAFVAALSSASPYAPAAALLQSSGDVVWVEDGLPAGAIVVGDADGWNWVNNPQPFSGSLAHQSQQLDGIHQHYFYNSPNQLVVNAGDVLVAYLYIHPDPDPAKMPREIMLQWNDGTWEHRAYWGEDLIPWGATGTTSRRLMGTMPISGQWVRLEVPASQVGLEGRAVNGMAFSLYNGKATWDHSAKFAQSSPVIMSILGNTPGSKNPNFRIQATGFSVSSIPDQYRVYGTAGYQQIRWNAANTDIENLYHQTAQYPEFGTLDNRDDCAHTKDPRLWDARCGTDVIGYFWKRIACPGTPGVACQDNDRWNASPGRYNLTPTPSPSIWPNSLAEDFGTKNYSPIIDQAKINSVQLLPADTNCSKPSGDTIWSDDFVPAQGFPSGDTDGWNWVTTNPAPFHGTRAHQSKKLTGAHQHSFTNTIDKLTVKTGDVLLAYVYLDPDPVNKVREIMLQWNDGTSLAHRAYWGENLINQGTNGTDSRRYIGALPATGQWVRLEVPASQVGLEGKTVNGMIFTLHSGQATWDQVGKYTPATATGLCPPKTGRPQATTFHAYNPDDYATGAANSKAVQVKYADGTSRWFMAFNSMIKYVSVTYPDPVTGQKKNDSSFGKSAADNWRVLWATSADGATWTVHPQVLFRSPGEKDQPWGGLLMVDMIQDNGYFYALFQDLLRPYLYLARCRIDTVNSTTSSGYVQNAGEGWSIAGPVVGGQYTWVRLPLGQQINFDSLGAAPIMPTRSQSYGGFVKQGSIARIFKTSAPGSTSRIFGVTNDANGQVQLWSAPDITQPLVFESYLIMDPSVAFGGNGWEFSFTHYADNVGATPRIVGSAFDAWVAERDMTLASWNVFVTKRDARLANY